MAFYLGSNRIDNLKFVSNSDFYNEENVFLQRSLTQFNSDVTTIGSYAFAYCSNLTSVNLPLTTTIESSAFYRCTSLASVELPQATTIGSYAFRDCTFLTSVELPQATTIGSGAFYSCTSLASIELPLATTIGSSAFAYCSNLTSINLPQATTIGNSAFKACYELTSVQCSALPIILGGYSFRVQDSKSTTMIFGRFAYCSSLQTVSFPKVQTIHSTAFYYCSHLTSFIGPSVLIVGGSYASSSSTYKSSTYRYSICGGAFAYCYELSLVSLPRVTKISAYAFYRCYNLLSLYLLGSSIPTLTTTAFYMTPISSNTTVTDGVHGSIYVPASLYSDYITATGWSVYSERIVSV